MRPARGFTLLEVMISIGILGVALLAIGDLNGGAVRMHVYSKQLTVATQLARGKLLDVQQLLRKDGLSDFSKDYHGTFDDDGQPDYRWRALVIKPEIDVDPTRIMDMISGGLGIPGGDGKSGGAPQPGGMANPLAAGGPLAGILDGQVKAMTEAIKQSVREIKLTVSWKGSKGEAESFDLVEHVVVLPNAQMNAAQNATPLTPGATPGSGVPGAPPIPGMGQIQGANGLPLGAGLPGGFPGAVGGMRTPFGIPPGGGFK